MLADSCMRAKNTDKKSNPSVKQTRKPKTVTEQEAPPKIGRPLAKVDPRQVEALASISCSLPEIAAVVGCSVDTLERRFAEVIAKGRENGRTSLKRAMFEAAVKRNNVTMQIWLSKQKIGPVCSLGLGYSEPREIQVMQPNEQCMVATKAVDGTMIVFKPGTDPIEQLEATMTEPPTEGSTSTSSKQ